MPTPVKSPADQIADKLVTAGIGTNTASGSWYIMVGRQQDKPDALITLYDLAGKPGLPTLRIDYPSIQARVRGARDDYRGAYNKINDVVEFLNGLDPQDIDGDHWSGIILGTGINSLGNDQNSRPEFTVTFNCFLERAADSSTYQHRASL